jgi:hypothetical protein
MADYSITGSYTYYINSGSGNDTSGNGSSGSPWKTISGAVSNVNKQLVSPGVTITLQLSDGTYSGAVLTNTNCAFKIRGNSSNVSATHVSGNLEAYENATVMTEYVKVNAVTAYNGGVFYVQTGSLLAASIYSHMYAADGGIIRITGNYQCQGNSHQHFTAEAGAIYVDSGLTLTINGSPAMATFAWALRRGIIRMHRYGGTRLNISGAGIGSMTGTRYSVESLSIIDTNNGGANYFPGNVGGSVVTSGLYF